MLNPEPTDEQIEEIREIIDVTDTTEVSARLTRLTQAAWMKTLEDIDAFALVKDKNDVIKGDGITIDDSVTRLGIVNRVRVRFGYPKVNASGQTVTNWSEDDDTQSVEVWGSW